MSIESAVYFDSNCHCVIWWLVRFLCFVQHVAPVPEVPIVTVQEAVARRMTKFRAKLGIKAADLLPASVALEGAESHDRDSNTNMQPSCGDSVDDGRRSIVGQHFVTADRQRCEAKVDIGRWKKEAEDMLTLLGSNSESAHQYPMTELKRKVSLINGSKMLYKIGPLLVDRCSLS